MLVIYSDINPVTPLKKPLDINIDAIFRSLYNIFNTRKGERVFLPTFGCDIDDFVFELIDDATALLIYQRLVEAVETWEKRVTLDYARSYVEPDYDNNTYYVRMVFTINSLSDQSFTYEGSLNNR